MPRRRHQAGNNGLARCSFAHTITMHTYVHRDRMAPVSIRIPGRFSSLQHRCSLCSVLFNVYGCPSGPSDMVSWKREREPLHVWSSSWSVDFDAVTRRRAQYESANSRVFSDVCTSVCTSMYVHLRYWWGASTPSDQTAASSFLLNISMKTDYKGVEEEITCQLSSYLSLNAYFVRVRVWREHQVWTSTSPLSGQPLRHDCHISPTLDYLWSNRR